MTRKPRPTNTPPPAIVVLPPGAVAPEAQFYSKLASIEHQLTGIDAAVRAQMSLLEAIVAHLETQGTPVPVQVASYEQLYRDEEVGGEAAASDLTPIPLAPDYTPGWWGRLFPTRRQARGH